MSRQFRYRMAALGLSGLIFGAPLLLNGTASAEQREARSRQVSFGGVGVLGLSCGSRPSVEEMTVPVGSVVRVVNQTGHDARLRLGGAAKGTIPADGTAEVFFRRGTTAVVLTPECSAGNDPTVPVLVTAAPSPSAEATEPKPATGDDDAAQGAEPRGSSARDLTGKRRHHAVASGEGSGRTTKSKRGARRLTGERHATAGKTAATAAKAKAKTKVKRKIKIRRGTAGVDAPAFAGMPPGGKRTILRGLPPVPPQPRLQVPDGGLVPAVTGRAAEPAVTDSGPFSGGSASLGTEGFEAAEPVASVGRIEDRQPLGLLGVTAMVCILGVATAAIRAIVSQRASRANMS